MRLPAEWEKQSGVQLTWPDESTPWYGLDKVQECYVRIASAIQRFEKVLVVAANPKKARARIREILAASGSSAASSADLETKAGAEADRHAEGFKLNLEQIQWQECRVNDTWARDHGGMAVYGDEGEKYLYDFVFNGWGLKWPSNLDNQLTKTIFFDGAFAGDVQCVDMRPYVLEGGSIDSDGAGTMLATAECLLSVNRNEYLTPEEIEGELKHAFGLERILWLDHGRVSGDDTDSHVDILARFCDRETIAYLQCTEPGDPDFAELQAMEAQLKDFRTLDGKPYRLVPLPKPEQQFLDGYPLPASYANFLIVNGAVLVPGVGKPMDEVARQRLQEAFPDREVLVIDCSPLLSGRGGLHCVTMQFPAGWLSQ